jgi:pimeloyl-ACP methyl ester carboxylesterase
MDTFPPPEKSTNVRLTDRKQRAMARRAPWLLRAGLGALGGVAPSLAERAALALWRRPKRTESATDPEAGPGMTTFAPFGAHRLAITRWGDVGAPPVLLVHGWSGHAAQMSAFVPPLLAAGLAPIAVDLPAHGQSSGREATLIDFADAIVAVGRTVGPLAGVIAHSLGATGAALAIARGLEVERGVLIAPPSEVEPFIRGFAWLLGLPRARADGMIERVRRELGGTLDAVDLPAIGPRVQTPLLLLHDPADKEVDFRHGEAIARTWPRARLLPLERAGHVRILRDARAVRAAASFLVRGRVIHDEPIRSERDPNLTAAATAIAAFR